MLRYVPYRHVTVMNDKGVAYTIRVVVYVCDP